MDRDIADATSMGCPAATGIGVIDPGTWKVKKELWTDKAPDSIDFAAVR